jgi:hypothetical protein
MCSAVRIIWDSGYSALMKITYIPNEDFTKLIEEWLIALI